MMTGIAIEIPTTHQTYRNFIDRHGLALRLLRLSTTNSTGITMRTLARYTHS